MYSLESIASRGTKRAATTASTVALTQNRMRESTFLGKGYPFSGSKVHLARTGKRRPRLKPLIANPEVGKFAYHAQADAVFVFAFWTDRLGSGGEWRVLAIRMNSNLGTRRCFSRSAGYAPSLENASVLCNLVMASLRAFPAVTMNSVDNTTIDLLALGETFTRKCLSFHHIEERFFGGVSCLPPECIPSIVR